MKTCPPFDTLKSFAIGKLSETSFADLSEHVVVCEVCAKALAQFDGYDDGLLSELKSLPKPITPVPREILKIAHSVNESLRGTGGGQRTSAGSPADPGQALAGRLIDGPVRLGRFELRCELGDGSFGYVFRARDLELDRDVAVKVCRAGSVGGEEEAHAFLSEARAAAKLSHPNIVAIHDSGQSKDGVCFLVSELIDGETLETRLRQRQFNPKEAARMAWAIAGALSHAHSQGVIHRDVKPSNVILDSKGSPHLADFGLAKSTHIKESSDSDGKIFGTPAYMSPEQARGDSDAVDARSDVYSLGVVLYELLTDERPFQGRGRQALLQVLDEDPRPPRILNAQVPRDLETICLKAMAKGPARRYQGADEFANDLQRYLEGEPIAARPVGAAERLWRWCRRFHLAASVIISVVTGSIVGFVFLSHLSTFFVRETALDGVKREADLFEGVNEFYSEDVLNVDRLQAYWDKGLGHLDELNSIKITHEYAKTRNALPYPKTFTIDAGKRISANVPGMKVRLYSDHPWREDGGPKNDFEKRALLELRNQVDGEEMTRDFHVFSEQNGHPVVQYARAQVMKDNCVNCHNSHQSSPRNDWKVGDVVGVLAITRPLDRDIERTRSGLRGAFGLVAVTAVLLLSVSLLLLPRRRRVNLEGEV